MKRVLLPLLCALLFLSGCGGVGASTIMEMELTENYDTSDPLSEMPYAALYMKLSWGLAGKLDRQA